MHSATVPVSRFMVTIITGDESLRLTNVFPDYGALKFILDVPYMVYYYAKDTPAFTSVQ